MPMFGPALTAFGTKIGRAANAAAVRTLLALGGAATLNVGTAAGTVAAGDDSRITGALQRSGGVMTGDLTLASNPTANLHAVTKQYADLLVTGVLKFKSNIDCSANPNYPAAVAGESYVVSVAGKIGGASGATVDAGDMIVCKADNAGGTHAAVGASWFVLEHNLAGALLAANNLGDILNVATARTNLGLGTAAVKNTGTSGSNVPLLDGANSWSAQQAYKAGSTRFTSTATGTEVVLSLDAGDIGYGSRDSQIRGGNNGANQTYIDFYTSNAAAPARAMRISETGNVGIGTATAADKLNISDGTVNFQFKPLSGSGVGFFGLRTAHPLAFTVGDTERMRIDAGGNVNVGSATPVSNGLRYFDVRNDDTGAAAGAIMRLITSNVANNGAVTFDIVKYRAGAVAINNNETDSAACLAFGVGASERVRIDSSGNVGVGTTSPSDKLHVNGGSIRVQSAAYPKVIYNSSGNGADLKKWQAYVDTAGNYKINRLNDAENAEQTSFVIGSNGNLGVGLSSTSPAAPLDITTGAGRLFLTNFGSSNQISSVNSANASVLGLAFQASVLFSTADNYADLGAASFRWKTVYAVTGTINTSDQRAKQDITPIPDEWLDAWGDVDWKRYKFIDAVEAKGDEARWHVGLVAQAVRDAFAARDIDATTIGLLCYDQWEEQTEPVFEEQQTGTETVTIGQEDTGILDAEGHPIMRDVTEERPIMEQIQVGTRVTLEAGDRWGLRYDECFAIDAAYQRRRQDRIVAALETLGVDAAAFGL